MSRIPLPLPPCPCLLVALALASPCPADGIDSGGSRSVMGTLNNHSSIGSPIATSVKAVGTLHSHSGLIEVLYAAGTVDPDSDHDGMPDDWEDDNGLIVGIDDSGLDSDGDATSNLLEWLAGTDPQDLASAFRPLGTHDGTLYLLPVPTIPGRSYAISISRNLADWLPYGTLIGDDTTQVWTFDEAGVPIGPFRTTRHPNTYFFRIEITVRAP